MNDRMIHQMQDIVVSFIFLNQSNFFLYLDISYEWQNDSSNARHNDSSNARHNDLSYEWQNDISYEWQNDSSNARHN
ncbi:unnamed protein product, partial [Rotaria sordida]